MSSSGRGDQTDHIPTGTRGVVEILGVVLLLGIVVLGIATITVLGGPALDDNKQTIEIAQAEHSLSQLDSRASRVALAGEPVQQVDLGFSGSDGTLDADETSGRFRVEVINANNGTAEEAVNTSLGAVTYDHGETTIAYQGGGVWRRDGESSVMISRPEFHYRNRTLTVPVVRLADTSSLYSGVEITRNGTAVRKYPNKSAGWENKLQERKIRISIRSNYYQAWGKYFEESTNGIVGYDHDAEVASVTFLALPDTVSPRSGIIATSGPGKLELDGNGNNAAYVDSYNSSEGDYQSTSSGNGTVEVVGDVNITGNGKIDGDVKSGSFVDIQSSSGEIDGDVYWADGFENDGTVTGNDYSINGIGALEPIDRYVVKKVDDIRHGNNNTDTEHISGNELDLDGTSGEIGPGTYYFDHLNVTGEKLVVNATGGDVTLGVRDWVKVTKDQGEGNLTVKGNGTVRLFVAGQSEISLSGTGLGDTEVNFFVGKNSAVHIPDEKSHRLRLLAGKDFNAVIAGSNGNNAEFDGVIYAPAGKYGTGFTYAKHADIYGAVVTGNLTLGTGGGVHFDRGLQQTSLPQSPTVSRLDYLYVSLHRIDIESE